MLLFLSTRWSIHFSLPIAFGTLVNFLLHKFNTFGCDFNAGRSSESAIFVANQAILVLFHV